MHHCKYKILDRITNRIRFCKNKIIENNFCHLHYNPQIGKGDNKIIFNERLIYSQTPPLKKQCGNRLPFRCRINSYAPGICVPKYSMCYDMNSLDFYTANGKAKAIRNALKSTKYPIFKKTIEALEKHKPLTDTELINELKNYTFKH